MRATRGQEKPIAQVYAENGCHLERAGKGAGSRVTRVQRMHSYLAEGPACPHHRSLGWDTCPMVHVFQGCTNLIRTLPTLPHAKTGSPEDVDTGSEDHAYDAATYLLVNLGTGVEFLAPQEQSAAIADELGPFEVHGNFARRPDPDQVLFGHDDDEDRPPQGTTQRSPFA
jgi:hypothetical protein